MVTTACHRIGSAVPYETISPPKHTRRGSYGRAARIVQRAPGLVPASSRGDVAPDGCCDCIREHDGPCALRAVCDGLWRSASRRSGAHGDSARQTSAAHSRLLSCIHSICAGPRLPGSADFNPSACAFQPDRTVRSDPDLASLPAEPVGSRRYVAVPSHGHAGSGTVFTGPASRLIATPCGAPNARHPHETRHYRKGGPPGAGQTARAGQVGASIARYRQAPVAR